MISTLQVIFCTKKQDLKIRKCSDKSTYLRPWECPWVRAKKTCLGCGICPHIRKKIPLALTSLLLLFFLVWAPNLLAEVIETDSGQPPIQVFVCIGPHLDFCRQIGGHRVNVQLLLPPGKSPATYAPSPKKVQALSRSQLFFSVGLPFEKVLLAKIKAQSLHPQIVDTQTGITLQPMPDNRPDKVQTDHHNHDLTGLDPHSWLDPRLALKQAATIHHTLSHLDPNGKDVYTYNFNILKDKLQVLHKELEKSLKPLAGSTIFVYHPAFGYFARAYKLHQLAIEIEGKKAKAKELTAFIKKARKKQARVIFVQPQFDQKSARKIAEALGCAVIPIDPLGQDYCANLTYIAKTIKENAKVER